MDEFLRRMDKKIAMLKQELARYENARNIYLEEMQGKDRGTVSTPSLFHEPIPEKSEKPLTKKEAIIRLLREHGPMPRKEIAEITGFKKGTLAFTLSGDRETFESKDGLWYLKNGAK